MIPRQSTRSTRQTQRLPGRAFIGGSTLTIRERTIFFFKGFWALLTGGALLAVLTVALQPITDVRDCPNYGGNGNASPFPDERWDFYYQLLLLGWLLAIVVEQLLPVTWKGRQPGAIVARGLSAFMIALTASCCVAVQVLVLCH